MKVLHIIHTFLTPTMTFVYNEVSDLSNFVDVTICCMERKEETKFPFEKIEKIDTGFRYERGINSIKRRLGLGNADIWKSATIEFERIIEKVKPDVIHCQFGTMLIFLRRHFKKIDIPIVVSYHGFDASSRFNDPTYVKATKKYLDSNVYPIFVSNDMRNRFVDQQIDFKNESILYYGTDVEFFTRENYNQPNDFTFLQVSSLSEKKGHLYTVRAFGILIKKLKEKNLKLPRLILGGKGPLENEIIEEIEKLDIQDHVKLSGMLTNLQVKSHMENASCFIHHSITSKSGNKEGIPNVIMEAMAMELPVLSSYHSGIPELVEHEVNGFLTQEKDVTTMSDQMGQIMNWGLKKENREKVVDLFEKKKRTQKLIEIYKKAITRN